MFFKQKNSGFTLIELSIVLLIIALIVSSVLVGQELIKTAEIKATISQYEDFRAGVGTFRSKYSGLPGDIKGQRDFGFIGDGNLDGYLGPIDDLSKGENTYFWNHLGASGAQFISGSFSGEGITSVPNNLNSITPVVKVGSTNWGVYGDPKNGTNYYVLGVTAAVVDGKYNTDNALSPLDAKAIDDKLDDGKPLRGIITAGSAGNKAYIEPSSSCVTSQGNIMVYFTNDKDAAKNLACTLRFKML